VQPIVDVGVVKLMLVGKQSIAVTLWNMATVRPLEHERQVLMQSAVQLLGASVAHASSHAAITGGSAAEYWQAKVTWSAIQLMASPKHTIDVTAS